MRTQRIRCWFRAYPVGRHTHRHKHYLLSSPRTSDCSCHALAWSCHTACWRCSSLSRSPIPLNKIRGNVNSTCMRIAIATCFNIIPSTIIICRSISFTGHRSSASVLPGALSLDSSNPVAGCAVVPRESCHICVGARQCLTKTRHILPVWLVWTLVGGVCP